MSDKELILLGIIIQLVLNVVFIFTLWKLEIKVNNLQSTNTVESKPNADEQ